MLIWLLKWLPADRIMAAFLNSLVLCAFSHAGYAQNYAATGFSGITAKKVVE